MPLVLVIASGPDLPVAITKSTGVGSGAGFIAVEVGTTSLRVRHASVDGSDRVCVRVLTIHAFLDLTTEQPRSLPDELTAL